MRKRGGLPEGWWIDEGRRNSGTTIFSPYWPHGGSDGDVLYAKTSPAQGWRLLVRSAGHGLIEGADLAEVLRRLPAELRSEVLTAQVRMEGLAMEQSRVWISRRRRYLRERMDVSKAVVDA